MPVATKLDRMVTCLDRLLAIKLINACVARSRDKWKPLYLYYQSVYVHQTWHDDNLPWGGPAYEVKWHFDHVTLWNYLTNKQKLHPQYQTIYGHHI